MVELVSVIDKIDNYRRKYAQFFSVVEDEYFDKKRELEEMCTYSYENDGVETSYLDEDKLEEFKDTTTKILTDVFDTIRTKNEREYDFLIRLMYHDYVMMLEYDGDLTPEEKEDIEKIEFDDDQDIITNLDDLKKELEKDSKFYLILINYLIRFDDLDYYEIRKLYYDNEKKEKYLNTIFPCHMIDKLYFTRTITSNELINEFKHGEEEAHTEIIRKLQILQMYDRKNYDILVSEMLENFYKNISYKRNIGICEDLNYNLFTLLETGNITILKDDITGEYNSLHCLIQELYNDKKVYDQEFKNKANDYYLRNGQKVKQKILKK